MHRPWYSTYKYLLPSLFETDGRMGCIVHHCSPIRVSLHHPRQSHCRWCPRWAKSVPVAWRSLPLPFPAHTKDLHSQFNPSTASYQNSASRRHASIADLGYPFSLYQVRTYPFLCRDVLASSDKIDICLSWQCSLRARAGSPDGPQPTVGSSHIGYAALSYIVMRRPRLDAISSID